MAKSSIINMGNDEFILYIRKKATSCNSSNDDLGKQIWLWLKKQGAIKLFEGKPQPYLWVRMLQTEIKTCYRIMQLSLVSEETCYQNYILIWMN
ncbi:MAG: hypothetical protein ACEPOW_10840 [Bacteroidales bacterium]